VNRWRPVGDARPDDDPWPVMVWPPPATTTLSGTVVEVRPLVADRDAEDLFAAVDHDAVWEHVAGRPEDSTALAETMLRRRAGGSLPWAVRLRVPYAGLAPGTCVGSSCYLEVSVEDARLEVGSTTYTPSLWGTAVNPDTKLLLLGHAFEVLRAGRVQLKTDVRNTRSQEAIARLGATYEGTLRRYQRRADGTVRDTALFSVVAEDWPRVRAGLQERVAAAGPTPRR
jgi:N-acetyltransferase